LTLEVVLVEPLGGENLATLQHDAWRLTARIDSRVRLERGQMVEVTLDMEHLHLFDQASGLALGGSDPSG
jgi:ABC-type sugar transport system ATPase subunit